MQDAWRAYLELALGLTEASRKKAAQVVKSLAEHSGAKVEDLQATAEELLATSLANRENVAKLVRFEVDRGLGKVGLATNEEVEELTDRVRQLEAELRQLRQERDDAESEPAQQPAARPAAKKAPAKKATAKTATKKAAAKKTTATKATAKKSTKKAAKKAGSAGSGDAA